MKVTEEYLIETIKYTPVPLVVQITNLEFDDLKKIHTLTPNFSCRRDYKTYLKNGNVIIINDNDNEKRFVKINDSVLTNLTTKKRSIFFIKREEISLPIHNIDVCKDFDEERHVTIYEFNLENLLLSFFEIENNNFEKKYKMEILIKNQIRDEDEIELINLFSLFI